MANVIEVPSYQEDLKELIEQLGGMIPEDKMVIFNKDAQQLAESYATPLKLKPGDTAPQFSLTNATGETVSLKDMLAHGAVVLTFYRGIWCPYCNLQLKNYQMILPQIKESGANLVAISPMTPDNSAGMIETNALEFEVLSDLGNHLTRQYTTVFKNNDAPIQAMGEMGYDFFNFYDDTSGELPVPATFVIAQDGRIVFANSAGGDYRNRTEPQAILDVLDALNT